MKSSSRTAIFYFSLLLILAAWIYGDHVSNIQLAILHGACLVGLVGYLGYILIARKFKELPVAIGLGFILVSNFVTDRWKMVFITLAMIAMTCSFIQILMKRRTALR